MSDGRVARSMMDVYRTPSRWRRGLRTLPVAVGLAIVVALGFATSRMGDPLPAVDRDTVWIDTVRRGPLVRRASARGVLVPEQSRWIPASSAGRVERVLAEPGAVVDAETVLIVLSSPELSLVVEQAAAELEAAEAEAAQLDLRLESDALAQQSIVAAARADARQAALEHGSKRALAAQDLVAELELQLAGVRSDELAQRESIEVSRLEILARSGEAQRAVQRARLRRLRATLARRQAEMASLEVRAGVSGVLQKLPVEVGQRVVQGDNLARVADPERLKAVLEVDEARARDIQPGQPVVVEVLDHEVPGRVVRVDPAVEGGTVTVDARLDGALPRGARPDLSVRGTVELERLADALFVGMPTFARAHATIGLFRIDAGEHEAVRVPVRLGRDSVQVVEVLEGLEEGSRVILSDMSDWSDVDRIRLR